MHQHQILHKVLINLCRAIGQMFMCPNDLIWDNCGLPKRLVQERDNLVDPTKSTVIWSPVGNAIGMHTCRRSARKTWSGMVYLFWEPIIYVICIDFSLRVYSDYTRTSYRLHWELPCLTWSSGAKLTRPMRLLLQWCFTTAAQHVSDIWFIDHVTKEVTKHYGVKISSSLIEITFYPTMTNLL